MAKQTMSFFASQLAADRALLHRACKSGKATEITKALEAADASYEKFKIAVTAAKERLDASTSLL